MTGSNNGLMPGGMGLGTPYEGIPDATTPQMGVSPDLGLNPAMNRGYAPIYRGNYNPLNPVGWSFQPPPEAAVGAASGPADPMPRVEDFATSGKPITPEQRENFNATMAAWQTRNPSGTSAPVLTGTGAPAPGPGQNALSPPVTYTDPDEGKTLPDGTPVSVAKKFIRRYEADSAGYASRWGYQGGMPNNYNMSGTGFPQMEKMPIGKNLYGGKYAGDVSSASGMYQFEEGTWNNAVAALEKQGVHISDFSPESQEKVATYMLTTEGMSPWAPYNARLASAYNAYKGSGNEPADLAGRPLAYWEKGYTPGATFGGGAGTSKSPVALPEVTTKPDSGAPAAGGGKQYEAPPKPNEIADATIRRSLMLQMLGQALKGMKLTPMQVGYDPFKVQQAGENRNPQVDVRGQIPAPMRSPVETRYLPAPQPIGGGSNALMGGMRRSDPGQAIMQSRMYENLFT